MENIQFTEVKDTFDWQIGDYEEYVAGYKLYKKLKEKWDFIEEDEKKNAVQ